MPITIILVTLIICITTVAIAGGSLYVRFMNNRENNAAAIAKDKNANETARLKSQQDNDTARAKDKLILTPEYKQKEIDLAKEGRIKEVELATEKRLLETSKQLSASRSEFVAKLTELLKVSGLSKEAKEESMAKVTTLVTSAKNEGTISDTEAQKHLETAQQLLVPAA